MSSSNSQQSGPSWYDRLSSSSLFIQRRIVKNSVAWQGNGQVVGRSVHLSAPLELSAVVEFPPSAYVDPSNSKSSVHCTSSTRSLINANRYVDVWSWPIGDSCIVGERRIQCWSTVAHIFDRYHVLVKSIYTSTQTTCPTHTRPRPPDMY